MTYTKDEAKPLLTGDEYELFCDSYAPEVEKLNAAELRQAVRRCRDNRDKYRDLQRRQAGAVREAGGSRGMAVGANERTTDKATIFAEALARYEERLAGVA